MDRTEALVVAQSIGLDTVMTFAGRTLDDSATGYGPALDRAYRAYIRLYELDTGVNDTDIAAADIFGFEALVRATTYDLILPYAAIASDVSVDAPLTNVKFSQVYRALKQLRDSAWGEASLYGYGELDNVGGFVVNLDFNENQDRAGREFG